MSLALITLSLLADTPAQAQAPSHYWKITYSQTGTWSSGARDHPTFGQATGQSTAWPVNPNYGGFLGGSTISINNVMQGTVTATLTWVPATGQTDPPPASVRIAESAIATDTPSWGGNGPAPTGQGTADDGLSDTSVADGYGRTSSGTHLITRDGTSGTIVLTDTLSATTPTSTFTPYPPPGYGGGTWDWTAGGCTVTFSVAVVPLAVTISSPIEIPYSYYKGNSQGGYSNRWTHQRNPFTGAMAVDSVATYSTADNAGGGSWIANTTLVANPVGFSDPTYAWASDFNPVAMLGVDMTQQSIPAAWFIGDVSNLPITKNITVTAQDTTDGATAANTYAITWHQPFEQWTDCQPAVAEEIDLIPPSSQPTDIPGGQVAYPDQVFHCTFEFGPNQMADGIETAQKILPVAQPFFLPIWQSLIGAASQPFDKALLGVSTSYDVDNDSDAFTEATYLTNIGREPLVPPDGNGNIGTHEQYKMTAGLLSAHYRKKFLQGDAYDVNGYVGPSPTKTARTVFKVQATGRYELITGVPH